MDYSIGLQKDKLISLYLSRLIPIDEIRNRIIKIKTVMEDEETLDYHSDRWTTIAGSHYIAHDTHHNKFSYIFNEKNYVVHADHKMDFYNLTGISYQIVELIHELIKIKNYEICNPFNETYQGISGLDDFRRDDWIKNDDLLFSKLSGLITEKINLVKHGI